MSQRILQSNTLRRFIFQHSLNEIEQLTMLIIIGQHITLQKTQKYILFCENQQLYYYILKTILSLIE